MEKAVRLLFTGLRARLIGCYADKNSTKKRLPSGTEIIRLRLIVRTTVFAGGFNRWTQHFTFYVKVGSAAQVRVHQQQAL